jgi:hypothetical protein
LSNCPIADKNRKFAVTNARFAALHGLSSPCPPFADARSTSQIARSSRAASQRNARAARFRLAVVVFAPASGLHSFRFARYAIRSSLRLQTEAILVFRIGRSKMLPVQPSKLETLDDLLAQAEHYANYSMRNMGRMPPTIFLVGPDGPLMFMPESLPDDGAKDDFATNARLMCIAHAATSVVMALEAWAKFATPGEKIDETEAPSEALDRREMIVLMGESYSGQKQKFLPIIRSGNGKFFGFGESEAPTMDEMKGRFAQLLPTKVPDAAMRDLALTMLKVKGLGRATPGAIPRLHRDRR